MCNDPMVKVSLVNADIWAKFGTDNEMVVSRLGRPLFPTLGYTIEGLEPMSQYSIELMMMQNDEFRYKFMDGKWLAMKKEPSTIFSRVIHHPDAFQTGEQWMKQQITFNYLKITSNEKTTDPNQIFLETRRKHTPVLNIQKLSNDGSLNLVGRYVFNETQFFTVTAYMNPLIVDLKIANNKYSKRRSRKERATPSFENEIDSVPKKMCPIQEDQR